MKKRFVSVGVRPVRSAMPSFGVKPAMSAMPFGGVRPASGAPVIASGRPGRRLTSLVGKAESLVVLLLISVLTACGGGTKSGSDPVTNTCHYAVTFRMSPAGRNGFNSDHFPSGSEKFSCADVQRDARVEDVIQSLRRPKEDPKVGLTHQVASLDLKAPGSKSATLALSRWYPVQETPGAHMSFGPSQEFNVPLTCDTDAREKCRFKGRRVSYRTFEGKTYSLSFNGVIEKLPPAPESPGEIRYLLSLNDLSID